MSKMQLIEDRVRAFIELGGGQQDFTGEIMDAILDDVGCTQKELESVMQEKFAPAYLGQYGIPNIWKLRETEFVS